MAGVGQKYMVIDLGGGTADITVHEKLSDGHLKELCHASGGDCGGTSVDNAFIQIIIKILGAPLVNLLKQNDPSAYLDLLREFETVKRKIETATNGKVNFTIPCATINTLCEQHRNETLSSMIQSSPFASTIELRGDKMRIDANIMKSLFAKTIDNIITLVKNVLKKPASQNVPLFLLVGGFAECPLVQSAFKKEFGNIRIIVPEEAGLSVLKGAVLFGHKPDYIASRVMRYTYGTNVSVRFNPDIHDPNRKKVSFGRERCSGTFSPIMLKNKSVPIGTNVEFRYHTTIPNQEIVSLIMYASEKEQVIYTDDESCTKIGEAVVDIPFPSEEERTLNVKYIFGNTEIGMTAEDVKHGTKCDAVFKLI